MQARPAGQGADAAGQTGQAAVCGCGRGRALKGQGADSFDAQVPARPYSRPGRSCQGVRPDIHRRRPVCAVRGCLDGWPQADCCSGDAQQPHFLQVYHPYVGLLAEEWRPCSV